MTGAVTRGTEPAWQEVSLRVSPLAELEEQMRKEQETVRELEDLMRREQQKHRDVSKDLADWTTSDSDVLKEPESKQKVHFERSFGQQAANLIQDYQDSNVKVSELREQQRNKQKRKLEGRIGKTIDTSNPLYEKDKSTLVPVSVGAVLEHYDKSVDRVNSSREKQREHQQVLWIHTPQQKRN